jgi:sterol desaturase/sphingolipid hydroxylase (fatty acid hydroxylase superfamily)
MQCFDFASLILQFMMFVPLERLLAARPSQPVFRRAWFTDLTYVLVNRPLIQFGLVAVIGTIGMAGHRMVSPRLQAALAAQPIYLQLVQIMLLADLGHYLAHRAFHRVPGLWRFHAVHHSTEDLDWLAAARLHPIDQILTKATSLLPAFILGYSDASFALFGLLFFWHSLLLHSNVRIGFGALNGIIASPRFHQWHHAIDREARDTNFGAQLSIFDRLFGTYYAPADRVPVQFGVDELVPDTYLRHLAYPLIPRRVQSGDPLAVAASR